MPTNDDDTDYNDTDNDQKKQFTLNQTIALTAFIGPQP